jgi:CelD/BcsL family acetyltransferase involved in cellulose biosynthesis
MDDFHRQCGSSDCETDRNRQSVIAPEYTDTPSRCEILRPSELDAGLAEKWHEWRRVADVYQSPFFSMEFAQAVGEVRSDARVAIFGNPRQPTGLLPFQLFNRRTIVPIGGSYNDLHGVIGHVEGNNDFSTLLRSLNTDRFRFHAMVDNTTASIGKHSYGSTSGFLADLSAHPNGYVAFLETTRQTICKQRKKTRKMIKDLGPLRLEFDCRDSKVLDRVIDLKRAQYRRTHIFDLLSVPWAQQLIRVLHERHEGTCRGLLSVLYAGDSLVAGHYGLIEGSMMHYWFPVYDYRYHQYSPGTALFLSIAEEAARFGVKKIDFGYGEQPYKVKVTDTVYELPFGCVDRSTVRWWSHRCANWLNDCRSSLPYKETLKPFVRRLFPNLDSAQYH